MNHRDRGGGRLDPRAASADPSGQRQPVRTAPPSPSATGRLAQGDRRAIGAALPCLGIFQPEHGHRRRAVSAASRRRGRSLLRDLGAAALPSVRPGAPSGDPEPAIGPYAWSRGLRIVPAYWLALTVTAPGRRHLEPRAGCVHPRRHPALLPVRPGLICEFQGRRAGSGLDAVERGGVLRVPTRLRVAPATIGDRAPSCRARGDRRTSSVVRRLGAVEVAQHRGRESGRGRAHPVADFTSGVSGPVRTRDESCLAQRLDPVERPEPRWVATIRSRADAVVDLCRPGLLGGDGRGAPEHSLRLLDAG